VTAGGKQVKRQILAATLLAALVSGSPVLSGEAGAGEPVVVEMKKFKFIPEEITVKVGTTVRWLNTERRQYHTVWFRILGEKGSTEVWPGEHIDKTFDKPGDYPYVCEPHEHDYDMVGIVHVVR